MKTDIREYQRSSAKLLLMLGPKASVVEFQEARGKAVVKTMIETTPPGSPKTKGASAKKAGSLKVKGDFNKAVYPVAPSRAESTNPDAIVQSLRRGGTVSKPANRVAVPQAALNAAIKARQADVGKLAAGLSPAAARLGYKPPAWIWRHDSPGSYKLQVTAKGIKLTLTNGVKYASEIQGLEARFQKAIDIETKKNLRQLDFLIEREARKAGFK